MYVMRDMCTQRNTFCMIIISLNDIFYLCLLGFLSNTLAQQFPVGRLQKDGKGLINDISSSDVTTIKRHSTYRQCSPWTILIVCFFCCIFFEICCFDRRVFNSLIFLGSLKTSLCFIGCEGLLRVAFYRKLFFICKVHICSDQAFYYIYLT